MNTSPQLKDTRGGALRADCRKRGAMVGTANCNSPNSTAQTRERLRARRERGCGQAESGAAGCHLPLHIEGHGVSDAGVDGEGEVAVDDGGAGDALPVGCAPHEVVRVGDGMAV